MNPATPTNQQDGTSSDLPERGNTNLNAWKKMKLDKKTGWTIILLIFFFPVGLFLMWKYSNWDRGLKWIITAIVTMFFLIHFIPSVSKTTQRQPRPQQTNTVNTQTRNTSTVTSAPVKTVVKITRVPSTAPTDDCSQYAGDQFQLCLSLQEGNQRMEELSHPLKVTIKYNDIAVYIANTETTDWDNCEVTINDVDPSADNYGTVGFGSPIKAGQTLIINWADMVNLESDRFNYSQVKPYLIDLDCTVNKQIHRSRFNL